MGFLLYLKYFVSIASLVLIGYVPVYFLLLRKKILDLEYKNISGKFFIAFLCFYVGSFLVTIFMITLSLFGISLRFEYLLMFVIFFSCLSLYFYFSKKFNYREKLRLKRMIKGAVTLDDNLKVKKGKIIFEPRRSRWSLKTDGFSLGIVLFAILSLLTLASFIMVVFFTFLFPIRFWDAIACWSLKAKAFFIDSDIFTFFTRHGYDFSHNSYPLYVSLLQCWIYIWIGKVDENLVKIIFPLFYLSGLFVLYHFFRKKLNQLLSILLVFIFSVIPIIADHGYIEYTNLLFSIVLVLAVYFLYLYRTKRRIASYIILSAVFFALLANIRSEGLVFLGVFLLISLWFMFADLVKSRHKRNAVLNFLYSWGLIIILLAPYILLKYGLGLPVWSVEWQQAMGGQGMLNIVDGLKVMAREVLFSSYDSTRAFLGSGYGPVWVVLIVLFGVNIKRVFSRANWVPFVFVLIGIVMVLLSISFITDFAGSVERYLLHIFPLAYLWILSSLPNSKRLG